MVGKDIQRNKAGSNGNVSSHYKNRIQMYLVKSYTNSDHTKDIKYYIFKFVKGKKKQQLEFVERSLKTMVAANNFSFPQNIVFTNKSELHRRDI